MTLVGQINNVVTRIGTEFKAVYANQGSMPSLTTTAKADLVSAINEVNTKPTASGGASINDSAPSTTTAYSGTKIESLVSAKPSINDAAASSTSLYSSSKTDGQIANAVSGLPTINDTTASTTNVYSSTHTDAQISTAVNNLVASAPGTMDTLNEIATALGDDPNFATTMTNSLAMRLRFDAAQTLSGAQKTQGMTNLGASAAADIGDVTTDFVATFNAAIV